MGKNLAEGEVARDCQDYLNSRTSNYEFRCIRYKAVYEKLKAVRFTKHSRLLDFGSGRCDLLRYLRSEQWAGRYECEDGSLDGLDLNRWQAVNKYEFIAAIEVIEHLKDPVKAISSLVHVATAGIVCTVPNPRTIDVLGCDPTHISIVLPKHFTDHGFQVEETSLFGKEADSLIAWWKWPKEDQWYERPLVIDRPLRYEL